MKRLILPILLALLGTGGGVGAGILLVKPAAEAEPVAVGPCGEMPGDGAVPEAHLTDDHAAMPADDGHVAAATDDGHATDDHGAPATGSHEYVRLDNQFVVPMIVEGAVSALVVVTLSVEVPAGRTDTIYPVEPRLRDILLQGLFDHANTGGFEGMFTATANMRALRHTLFTAVDQALPGLVSDVLIVDIVRQDS